MAKNDTVWGLLGVVLGAVGFILILLLRKNDKYAMYYGRQGLVLTIAYVIVIGLGVLPLIGNFIEWAGSIFVFVLWVIGIVYSLSGKMKEIPLVGEYAKKIKV